MRTFIYTIEVQTMLIFGVINGYFDDIDLKSIVTVLHGFERAYGYYKKNIYISDDAALQNVTTPFYIVREDAFLAKSVGLLSQREFFRI